MWEVILTKKPVRDDFRKDFFPRKVHYKRDALKLVTEVKRKGGEAVVQPAKKV